MVKKITKAQWQSKRKQNYAHVKNGKRYVLTWSDKGTTVVEVEVIGMRKLNA